VCRKNIEMEPSTLDFVRSLVVGKQIAGDFGNYLEVHEAGLHVFSTESPIEDHRL